MDHDVVAWLELPWLGRPVVVPLLGLLGLGKMFPDEGHDPVDPLPHLPDVLHRGSVGRRLLLPSFPGDVE